MSRIFYFGDTVNAVASGNFFTETMSSSYRDSYFNIQFYSDAGITPATPTDGTVSFKATDDRSASKRYKSIIGGNFKAEDVDDENRIQPTVIGPLIMARIALDSVIGATHFSAWIERGD